MPSVEQLFARYRDHGDLQSLAAVFDALAPQLLLVAGHLVRDGALAEDLLQTTFVEAMRCARRYDARRPLLPWLARILTNHARKVKRSGRRVPDARRLGGRDGDDPFAQAQGREVVDAVQQALARLPVGYRQVLMLRLVHELPPTAIAHALGCPPETVKTRLKRGMVLLRQQLPKGIAVLLAVAATNGRGIAAVRADVLGAAGRAVSKVLPWSLASIGVLAMKKVVSGVALLAVLALIGWWVSAAMSAPGAGARGESKPRAEVASLAQPGAEDGTANERNELQAAAATAQQVVFRGRCLDGASGAPLASCRAAVWCKPADADDADFENSSYELGHPVAAATASAVGGDFELTLGLQRNVRYVVKVWGESRVGRRREFGPWTSGQTMDLGDIDMRSGVALSGSVVDRRGHPIAGVEFGLTGLFPDRLHALPGQCGWRLRSDADGSYAVPQPIAAGSWRLLWSDIALPQSRQWEYFTVAASPASCRVDFVLPIEDDAQTIRGRVLDGDGAPVHRLSLHAQGGGTVGLGMTRADGRFAIWRIEPYDAAARGPVQLTLCQASDGYGLAGDAKGYELAADVNCAWGQHDVAVIVRAAQRLTVRPLDPRTHAVVDDYEVVCAEVMQGDGERLEPCMPPTRRLPGGECVLTLSARAHVLQVLPHDPGLAPSALVRRESAEGAVLDVEVPLAAKATVRVVTRDGEPVAGTEVWSLRAADAAASPEVPERAMLILDPFRRWSRAGVRDQPLDHGSTDQDGRVRLRVAAGATMVLAALGPGHVPVAVTATVVEREEVQVIVDRGCSLRCRFTPDAVVRAYMPTPRVERWLQDQPEGRRTLFTRPVAVLMPPLQPSPDGGSSSSSATVAADGSCRFDGVTPGRYDLILQFRHAAGVGDGSVIELPLGSVVLRAGQVTEFTRDLTELTPCRLRGQVFVNGEPLVGQGAFLVKQFGIGRVLTNVYTDAEGRFEVDTVPGRNQLQVISVGTEQIDITPGHVTDAVFSLRRVAARVRILTADGKPAPGLRVTVNSEGEAWDWQSWTTDADGCVTLAPAPLQPFALVVQSPDRATGLAAKLLFAATPGTATDALLGPFRVPAVGNNATFEDRLPDGWR